MITTKPFVATALCAVLLGPFTGRAHADEYKPLPGDLYDHLPDDTATQSRWFPRYAPGSGLGIRTPPAERRRAVDAWAADARAVAAELAGTQLAADLLFSAATLYRWIAQDPVRFRALTSEAIAAYASSDPGYAVATVRLGKFELAKGNAPAAEAAFAALDGWRHAVSPADLDESDAARWAAFFPVWRDEYPELEAGVLESRGQFAEAARVLEARARAVGTSGARDWSAGRRYEAAAKMYARAGEAESASRVMGGAIDATDDPRYKAQWRLWQLYAKHEVLNRFGVPGPSGVWPGEAFEADARAVLEHVESAPVPSAMNAYLVIGSHAHLTGNNEFAVEVYLRAIDNPYYLDAARKDPSLISDLTMGVLAAISVGRIDEAERLLDLVVQLRGEKPPMTDELYAEIQRLRAEEREKRHDAETEPPEEEADDTPPLRIDPGIRPRVDDTREPVEVPTDVDDDGLTWTYALGAILLVLLVLLLARRR